MRISILGMGYVGTVSGACMAKLGHSIIGVDKNPDKLALLAEGKSPIVEPDLDDLIADAHAAGTLDVTVDAHDAVMRSDVSFISVGTPSTADGGQNTQYIDQVTKEVGEAIARKSTPHTVVMRSTVLPGYTEERALEILEAASGRKVGEGLELCFNPEFLREGVAVRDFVSPPYTVVGSVSEGGYKVLEEIYSPVNAPFVRTDCKTAESIKYLSNCYHAVKITFANEFGALLKSLGMDSRESLKLFCQDHELNISAAYLKPGFAFGGSCLPKELRAVQYMAREHNLQLPMLGHVLDSNHAHINRAYDAATAGGRRKIALFGLAFKSGTDDLRESPLVMLAEKLLGKGYELQIFDRDVHLSKLTGGNKAYIEREIPHLEKLLKGTPQEALDGAEVVIFAHAGSVEIRAIAEAGGVKTIVDLAGVPTLRDSGAEYEGICW